MTPDLMARLKADSTKWLLEPSNPGVRFFTLRDLLGYSEQEPSVKQARLAIPQDRTVTRIFAQQKPEGNWEAADQPYLPKYKRTTMQSVEDPIISSEKKMLA